VALNRVREHATRLRLPVPDGTESGDPLVIGGLPCVAVTDKNEDAGDMGDADDGCASVQTDGSWAFPVKGEDDNSNQAIAVGDIVYIDSDGEMNVDAVNGDRFGYALGVVESGATTEIEVKIGY